MERSRALGRVALACALVSVMPVASASGAEPRAGARFAVHDHRTPADGWHLELEVSADPRRLRQLVLHSERCGATVLAKDLPVGPGGLLEYDRPFTSRGRAGNWRLSGRFTDPVHLEATFRIGVGDCDGGPRTVSAHAGGHHHEGTAEHNHFHTGGTPPDEYPNLRRASPARRAQARRLWRASLRIARERFPTYRAALRHGYRRFERDWRKPLVFHVRQHAFDHDGRVLVPRRVESLVYWWPRRGSPVLVGFMYRYPSNRKPTFGAPLFGWHKHSRTADNQMTHVWMTGSLRTALANCLPVRALERANPRFRYEKPGTFGSHNSTPCPGED